MERVRRFIRSHSKSEDESSSPTTTRKPFNEPVAELLYEAPGQHQFEGVYYAGGTPDSLIKSIRDDFKFGDGDVLIVTYPKSGTTWLQEILYLIHNGADPAEAKTRPPFQRIPFLEIAPMFKIANSREPPRLMKTHLQARYLRKQVEDGKVKVIFCMRNPKDTLVSYYHFYQKMKDLGEFSGSWSDWYKLAKADQLILGDWFDFTLPWWEMKDRENVLTLRYEEMKKDSEGEIRKVAEFCGKELSDDQFKTIVDATSFATMKKDPKNDFKLRKGATGDWRNHFTVAENDHFDQWMSTRLENTGLSFDFDD